MGGINRRHNETGYIKYMVNAEFKKFRSYISKRLESPSMKMAFEMAMYTGMRIGEICKLKRENFNKGFTEVTYNQTKVMRKHTRKLPKILSRKLKTFHKKHKHKMKDGYLFFTNCRNKSKNKHIQRNSLSAKFWEIRKKLKAGETYYTRKDGHKLNRISTHTWRHFAIWRIYLASGRDIVLTSRIIGHLDIKTTAGYIQHIERMIREQGIINRAYAGI